jgi:hypothetical protein
MKRLYITQRSSITRVRVGPASERIAAAAPAATTTSRTTERRRKRKVLISAMAAMNAG